jgi:hypothetical protein
MTSGSQNHGKNVTLEAQKFQKSLDQGQMDMISQKYHVTVNQSASSSESSKLYDITGDSENIIRFITSNEWYDACGGTRMDREQVLSQYPQLTEGSQNHNQSQSQSQSQNDRS